ncbi:hypothetical protein RCH22_001938 [Cryobacterium psychrotolerans]|nr:hypothetical protein [Cryobacterium psychrotolerans]
MPFLAMGFRDSPFVPIALITIVVLFMGTTAVGFYGLYAFGRDVRKDLATAGFPTDRRAPMQYPRLFEQWLDRNVLTSETVVSVGNALYGEHDDTHTFALSTNRPEPGGVGSDGKAHSPGACPIRSRLLGHHPEIK